MIDSCFLVFSLHRHTLVRWYSHTILDVRKVHAVRRGERSTSDVCGGKERKEALYSATGVCTRQIKRSLPGKGPF